VTTSKLPPARQLAGFLAKFTPGMVADAKAALAKIRTRVPNAVEMVYDNYNGLVIGFAPNDRPSDAVLSMVVLPDHVTLCFLQSAPDLPDPQRLLKGSGNVVRHIKLASPADLDTRPIQALITAALERADVPFDPKGKRRLVIRSISAKQRPRRRAKT
jgi:hypothetical protein